MGLYVAPDGNYGDSEGMVVIDNESFDEHFYNYLDAITDWLRPDYAVWFRENDHDFQKEEGLDWACSVCEHWFEGQK